MTDFAYSEMLPLTDDTTPYRLVTTEGIGEVTVGDPEKVINPGNLSAIYGMEIRILTAKDPQTGDIVKFCDPARKARAGVPCNG